MEYKGEAFKYFEELMNNVRLQICTGLFRSASNIEAFENMLALLSRSARAQGPADALPAGASGGRGAVNGARRIGAGAAGSTAGAGSASAARAPQEIQLPKVTIRRDMPKVGRNDPCPCGSGKKYKQCHGH